jgi:virulence-associated protein VagC
MFTLRFWDPFGSDGVSCVKLPAAVAFPTDHRLLRRIEESRRALPANNMKALWKRRERASAEATPPCALSEPAVEPVMIKMPTVAHDAFRARSEPRLLPQAVQMSAVPHDAEVRSQHPEPQACVVPLARAAVRGRDGFSASAA